MRHVLLVLAALAAIAFAGEFIDHIALRIRSDADLAQVARLRLSVEGRKNDTLIVRVTEADMKNLRDLGFSWTQHRAPSSDEVLRIIRGLDYGKERAPKGAEYHNYVKLTEFLQQTAENHKTFVRLSSIGKTIQGRELWALRITDNPDAQEREPEVKFIGNIHGDETVGRENLIRFITLLTTQYGIDARITRLIDTTDIYIIPSMNPDGFEAGSRYNQPAAPAQGVDLNRNFPDQFDAPGTRNAPQPETQAVMDFCNAHYFVLSISFHGGDLVVNYPWDGNREHRSGVYSAAPDDDVFRAISHVYADKHTEMRQSTDFKDGITNGAQWYVLYGGMQDWNYIARGTFEVTVELSMDKTPPASQLNGFFEANKESMISFLEIVHTGVRGVVRKAGKPAAATITVDGIAHKMYTDPAQGDFYRPLTEGTYVLRVRVGDEEQTRTVYVPPMVAYRYTEVTFSFE